MNSICNPLDVTSDIIAYENGELGPDQVIALYQQLLDTGALWHLQGHYQRVAQGLLDAGLIVKRCA
jgi:hypothetical protein